MTLTIAALSMPSYLVGRITQKLFSASGGSTR
jgi:hypothetical protein